MASLPTILFAADGSDQSRHTITYLRRILSPNEVYLELFHVRAEVPEAFFDGGETSSTAAYETEIETWKSSRGIQINQFMDFEPCGIQTTGISHSHFKRENQPCERHLHRSGYPRGRRHYRRPPRHLCGGRLFHGACHAKNPLPGFQQGHLDRVAR